MKSAKWLRLLKINFHELPKKRLRYVEPINFMKDFNKSTGYCREHAVYRRC